MEFDNSLVGVVVDRFGTDVMIIPKKDDKFTINVDVSVSSMFYSWVTRGKAMRLLRSGFIHLLGSDCHNLTDRPPAIGSAYEHIEKKLGRSYVERITETGNALLGL